MIFTSREELISYLDFLHVFSNASRTTISKEYSGFASLRKDKDLITSLQSLTHLDTSNVGNLLYQLIHPEAGSCPICKKPLKFISFSKGYSRTCGNKECIDKIKDFHIKQTCLKKYGTKSYSQTKEWLEKTTVTNQSRYGKDFPTQTENHIESVKKTLLKKYQVPNIMQCEEGKKRQQDSVYQHWGKKNYTQTSQYNDQLKNLNQERYGVDNYFQSVDFKEKSKETLLKKYGVPSYSQAPDARKNFKSKYLITREDLENLLERNMIFNSREQLISYLSDDLKIFKTSEKASLSPNFRKIRKDPDLIKSLSQIIHCQSQDPQELVYRLVHPEESGICKICGKPTRFIDYQKGYQQACSPECRKKLIALKVRKTVRETYGVDNIASLSSIKEKKIETCRRLYGTDYPAQSSQVQDKMKATVKERYGKDFYSQTKEYSDRVHETHEKKYGKWFTQTKEYLDNFYVLNLWWL